MFELWDPFIWYQSYRTKQLWLIVLLNDTSAAAGNRTHILVFWQRQNLTRPLGHDTPQL